ncbi:MAG: clostripain-related cysteine peptidase [Bacteroidota bacterium]|nr:clostripain-related cysteine peptidase [Bacteroidota bacterium]
MSKPIINLLFVISILLTASCTHEWEIESSNLEKRTLLVYLAGDNDLSIEVAGKTNALLEGWKPGLGDLLVFVDTYGEKPVLTRAVARDGQTTADTLRIYSETNSASPQLLREVISDTRRLAPATSYGLILFSHATGWLPAGAFENPHEWRAKATSTPVTTDFLPLFDENPLAWRPAATRSLFKDGTREMELVDFVAAIPDGMFDFMVFDMCFMAGVEVAYALRRKTPLMVATATEILSPGFTPIYSSHLSLLYKPEADLSAFAEAFFNYFNALDGVYRSATVSVIRTAETEPLVRLMKDISPNLTPTEIENIQYFDRKGKPHLFFDLGDYLHAAAKIEEQHRQVNNALARAVIFKKQTSRLINLDILKHSGLSVYIPQEGLKELNEAYKETSWAKAM